MLQMSILLHRSFVHDIITYANGSLMIGFHSGGKKKKEETPWKTEKFLIRHTNSESWAYAEFHEPTRDCSKFLNLTFVS